MAAAAWNRLCAERLRGSVDGRRRSAALSEPDARWCNQRRIETEYRTGSSLLEPWHQDSVGHENRLESTLQSVRRKVILRLVPDEAGRGYVVSVEAYKEFEDLPGVAANSPGGATFQENTPLQRDLNLVVGQSAPSGWIPAGRDLALEQRILQSLQVAYTQ
jgi:hypothetical protein